MRSFEYAMKVAEFPAVRDLASSKFGDAGRCDGDPEMEQHASSRLVA